jgi:hypothetical protein
MPSDSLAAFVIDRNANRPASTETVKLLFDHVGEIARRLIVWQLLSRFLDREIVVEGVIISRHLYVPMLVKVRILITVAVQRHRLSDRDSG